MTSGGRLLAVGWTTVELDRAAGELAHLLVPGGTFAEATPCEQMGAWCRIGRVRPGAAAADIVVLLEPSTEGRLAATLARHDEGWQVTWEAAADAANATDPAASDLVLSVERPGPLGPERLVLGGPATGPHRLVVTAATIAP
ncbi:MAG: hypothetical protein ACSLFN_09475 [Candidatus Limnocylindrales bacterium]